MERIWLKQYPAGVPADIDVNQYSSLVELLEESFAKFSDRKAFICMDKSISYRDLDEMSAALGAYLQSKGLGKGRARRADDAERAAISGLDRRRAARRLCGGERQSAIHPARARASTQGFRRGGDRRAGEFRHHGAAGDRQDRGQACDRRQHGRFARLQGRDRQSGSPESEENGAGLVDPGRGLVQRCARRRPWHEAEQAAAHASRTSPSCNIRAERPAFPRARRCSTATSWPTCCRTMPGCSRR